MRFLRSVTLGLIGLLLVISLPVSLLVYNLGRQVFDPPVIQRAITTELVEADLGPALLQWSAGQFAFQAALSGQAAAEPYWYEWFQRLELADWRQVYRTAVPALLIDNWIANLLTSFYTWLEAEQPTTRLSLDISPLHLWLAGPHGQQAMDILYERLEPCTEAQEESFRAALLEAGAAYYELCRYQEPMAARQLALYRAAMDPIRTKIPQTIIIEEQPEASAPGASMQAIKQSLRGFRLAAGLGWMLPLGLLLLMAPKALESRKGLAQWWGIPLLAAGLLGLIPAVFYTVWLRNGLAWMLVAYLPGTVLGAITASVLQLVRPAFQLLLSESIILALIGAGLILQLAPVWLGRRRAARQALQEMADNAA